MPYTDKSEQQIINELLSNSPHTSKSVQEALNTYYGYAPQQYSLQELLGLKTENNPHTSKSVQEYIFDNIKDSLSLTGSYTEYSTQELLRRAQASSLTIDQIVAGQSLQSYIKSLSGLVAYYPLDETSGNAINQAPDTLGSYDGTVVGATQGVAGQVGNAYQFDGVNDDILIGTLLDPNYSAMTLGGIIYVDSTGEGANRTIMAKRDTYAEADMRWQLTIGSGNLFFFGRSGSSNVFESGTYSTNTFFLFHIVQKASNLLYYRNGALIQTDTATTNGSDGTSEFRIGSTSSVEYFKGKMQHLHIVNRELNTTEIGNIKSLSGL